MGVRSMSKFELQKWYFDCVGPHGKVFIGYAAKLRLYLISLNYGCTITVKNGKSEQKQSFSFGKLKENKECLEWSNNSLGLNGKWIGKNGTNKNILYQGKEGKIVWQCLKPNASVLINQDGKIIEGVGYVEKLYITVPPWKLPFEELRWGRFISNNKKKYLIWIDWKGELSKNWIWTEKEISSGIIKDNTISTKKQKLILYDSKAIRLGKVSDSLLGKLKFLSNLFPKKMSNIDERKYLNSGDLFLKDGSKISGSSINEIVKWI